MVPEAEVLDCDCVGQFERVVLVSYIMPFW
jgi:hypothetical protein